MWLLCYGYRCVCGKSYLSAHCLQPSVFGNERRGSLYLPALQALRSVVGG